MAKSGILLTILVVLMLFIGCVVSRSTSSKPLAESSLVISLLKTGKKWSLLLMKKSRQIFGQFGKYRRYF